MAVQGRTFVPSTGSYTVTLPQGAPAPQPRAPAAQQMRLSFAPRVRYNFRPAFTQLLQILNTYQDWNDPLSLRIHEWGRIVTLAIPATATLEGEITEAERTFAQERIHELAQNILLDPIGMVRLRAPVIADQIVLDQETWAEDVVVDRETWQEYCEVTRALFPARPVPTLPPPHAFAAEIIMWLSSLPADIKDGEATRPLAQPAPANPFFEMVPPSPTELMRDKFYKLRDNIGKEHICQLCSQISMIALAAKEECQKLHVDFARLIHTRILLLNEELQAENERLAGRLRTISLIHQTRIAELQREIDRLQQEVGALHRQMEEAQSSLATQEQSAQDLRARCAQTEQKCQEVERKARNRSQCSIT